MSAWLLALTLILAQAAQPPRDRPVQPAPTGGVIQGRVLDARTDTPLNRAVVELSAPELPRTLTTRTDAKGSYEFRDLPAGRYSVRVSKPRYLSLQYGQRRPYEQGRRILLEARGHLRGVDVRLPPAAVLAGRVLDPSGDPIDRVWVQVFRSGYEDGRRRLVSAGRAVTNDIGEYRLSGLAPGDYYVFAREMAIPPSAHTTDTAAYANTFYPGVARVDEAERIRLGLGQEMLNLDMTMPIARTATLSGRVVRVDGTPVPDIRVSLLDGVHSGSDGNISGGAMTDEAGRFRISGVGAASYQLVASDRTGEAVQAGAVALDVTGADQPGLAIVIGPGGTFAGRVVTTSGEPPPFASGAMLAGARLVDGVRLMTGESVRVARDFTVSGAGLLGRRVIRAPRLPDGWWLQAVMLEGRDVIDEPIAFDHGIAVAGVALVLDDKPTTLEGVVRDSGGNPVEDYTVIAFAPDRARWGAETRFVQAGRPDHAGRFRLTALPPGDYLVAAVEFVETGQWFDPEYLETLRRSATPVAVAPGEAVPIDLPLHR